MPGQNKVHSFVFHALQEQKASLSSPPPLFSLPTGPCPNKLSQVSIFSASGASEAVHGVRTNAHLMFHTSLACMALARARHHQKLVVCAVLIFALQIPLLLSSCSAHAIAVVDPAAAGRRLLPLRTVQAAQSVEVKETVVPHPRSMERRAGSSSTSAAFMNAVSKHQVPSGANPDSN